MRRFRTKVISAAIILLVSVAVIGLALLQWDLPAHSASGTVDLVAIDMDTTGNTDSAIPSIENCGEIANIGDTLDFDLVVKGIHPDDKIAGYQVDIDFDPAVVEIIGVIDVDAAGSTAPDNVTILSRLFSGGGAGFQSLSEYVADFWPDVDGSFETVAQDATAVPEDRHEDGDGVLARVTLRAVGNGVSTLVIPGPLGGIPNNGVSELVIIGGAGTYAGLPIPIITSHPDGQVVVGGSCSGSSLDSDGDAFVDGHELFVGTDPADACADTITENDEVDDKWPADFDDNRSINLVDLNKMMPPPLGSWGAKPGDGPYSVRRDIVPDGVINLLDLNKMMPAPLGSWGETCTDDDGKPGQGPKK